jgi:uncharacterized protein (TIGR00255 family)
MTGFGEASAQQDGVHYFVEVRSLNSKFFKAAIRLPDAFQGLEAEMETALRRRVHRGTVTLTGSCTDTSEAFEVNHVALERYIEQIRRAPSASKAGASIDIAALLNLPGVLQPPANEEARLHRARGAFLPLLERACDGLQAMREVEGKSLREELLNQRNLIAARLATISERAPSVVAEYEARLQSRIQTMLQAADLRVEPAELIREIAVYAEKTDIAEEISRLSGHIEQFSQLLDEAEKPVGRTLDFLSQEMLREANTIASKSPNAEISRSIVEVKGAIDRIKEQVQNVE